MSFRVFHDDSGTFDDTDTTLPLIFKDLALAELETKVRAQIFAIDAVLPQTQCGLCGHAEGCLPYAHAIITQNAATNLCVPGGNATSHAISTLTHRPYSPAVASVWQTNPVTDRPHEVRAVIDEAECIGCTKCIPACPVDAIIGTAKHMHSILTELCTGCELCLPPCPVDCIQLVPVERTLTDNERSTEQIALRARYHRHLRRAETATSHTPTVSVMQSKVQNALQADTLTIDANTAKNTIAAAKLRTQLKKLQKQLTALTDPNAINALKQKIDKLENELAKL